jgi:hypothetical protein
VPIQESAGASTIASNLTLPGINEFILRNDSSGTSYFLTDRNRSTLALANASGIIQTEYTYAFFGGLSSVTGVASSNPYQFRASHNDATGLRRPLCVCNDPPRIDPISMTQVNFPPPITIPSNRDPNEPSPPQPPTSQTRGPEGGRKPESGSEGEGNSGPATSEDPGKPPSTVPRPRPGPLHGPFKPDSDWSRRLESHTRDLEFWRNVADWAVWGLSKAFDGLTGKGLYDGLWRASGAPQSPVEALTDVLRLPTSPSDIVKVAGEMVYNGASPTEAISTVMGQKSCFVCW